MESMNIYILIRTHNCETEELGRYYFRRRKSAVEKARELMDEELPKRRKTRQDDIDYGVNELDKNGFTQYSMLYSEYRIVKETLN